MSIAEKCIKAQNTEKISGLANNNGNQIEQAENKYTKLPDVPSFSGTCDTWLSFYDIIKSEIHIRNYLSDVQKLIYLKLCCKGDALRVIESLEVTAENYVTALESLKKRFENRCAMVNHHIKILL